MSQGLAAPHRRTMPLVCAYLLMIIGTVVAFLAIRHFGKQQLAESVSTAVATTATAAHPSPPQANPHTLFHVLLAMAAVIVAGRLLGAVFTYLGQPPVIGEVMAGILLGPSLLGYVWPDGAAYLLPAAVAPQLGILAQIGVILYMFIVGLELDTELLKEKGHAAVAVSHASIIAPFLLGSLLAIGLYDGLSSNGVSFTVFAMFLGAAMSITAFPVLARILTDRGLSKTPLGAMALTCAASDDATAWCLLALVVSVAQSAMSSALTTFALVLVYLAIMFFVVRPLLMKTAAKWIYTSPSQTVLAAVLVALLFSTLTTELIGVHAIFGAFVLGAIIPHDSGVARELTRKLEDFVCVLLLPAFFAFTGMRTQLSLVSGWNDWMLCGLIILVATLGKFGGTLVACLIAGLKWREGASLGVLMNTRGLMELIVLNIGLDMGVISPRLFAMMVVMALVTTVATTPILAFLWPQEQRSPSPALSG